MTSVAKGDVAKMVQGLFAAEVRKAKQHVLGDW